MSTCQGRSINLYALSASIPRSSNDQKFDKKGHRFPQGGLHDTVATDLVNIKGLSVPQRNKWMKSSVLKTIYYCSRALKAFQTPEERSDNLAIPKPNNKGFNHEFIIVEVSSEVEGWDHDLCVFVKAEKTAPSAPEPEVAHADSSEQNEGGVSVSVFDAKLSEFQQNVIHSFTCNVQVPLKKILEVLDHDDRDRRYHPIVANCWDYAIGAFKRVLSVLEKAETDPNLKGKIQKEHETLEDLISELREFPISKE